MVLKLDLIRQRLGCRLVDALAGLLDGPQARQAFVLKCVLEPPWAILLEDRSPLSVIAVVAGEVWVVAPGAAPVRLGPGSVGIARGPQPYTVADHPDTEPQIIIHPGQRCATPDGQDLHDAMTLGVRTWGNHASGSTVFVCGSYESPGTLRDGISQPGSMIRTRLLEALPDFAVLDERGADNPYVRLLAAEIATDLPGQQAVLDRLLDLVLISALRSWFNRPGAEAPRWYVAHADPIVGPALRLLLDTPAAPWTVAALADAVGVSRAGLARRFTDLLGEPPMRFLANWRLDLAADLLRRPGASVTAVARQVGYGTPYALSTAFKRHHGVSPDQHRRGAA
jgi:AraC-like DNA-binding protein